MCCLQSKCWTEFSLSLLCVSDTQSYLTLLWPSGLRPAASSVHVIPLARMLEWIAISFSRGSSPKLKLSSENSCLMSAALAGRFSTPEPPGKPHRGEWWWVNSWVLFYSCDPTEGSQPGSSVHRIFQTRILEWVTISFSKGSSRPTDWTWVSCSSRQFLYRVKHQGNRGEYLYLKDDKLESGNENQTIAWARRGRKV